MKKILVIFILLFSSITLFIISNQKENEVILSNINNNIEGLAFYLQSEEGSEEYNSASIMPSKNDGYIFKEAVCNDESNVSFNNATWSLKVSNMQEGKVRCKLYFDIDDAYARKYILSQNVVNEETPDFTKIATTNEGIFTAEDDYGTSYYYRGAVDNNYFYFAGYYWRIIRINGDGTLRLIYQGTSPTSSGVISTKSYNLSKEDNAYVGYMYKLGVLRGYENDSTVKEILDNWYNNNLLDYANYINTEQGFCNDRSNNTSSTDAPNDSAGIGTSMTHYGPRYRTYNIKQPSYKCGEDDLFTVINSNFGNNHLTNPIGLITSDEVMYAGGLFNTNNPSYYLNSGQSYWTMSPSYFSNNEGWIFHVSNTGNLYRSTIITELGVRPVININKNVILTGNGTASDPYRISDEEMPLRIKDVLLSNYSTIVTRVDFNNTITATTTGTIYKSLDETQYDNDGEVYYFAGNPTDNWVKFGEFYWRIIRINGDGSLRLIYQGTEANTTGDETQIGVSTFNIASNDNTYVGYMYQSNQLHGTSENSAIKNMLETWYKDNLLNYANKINKNASFCNDRTLYSGSGIGWVTTYYGAYNRLDTNKKPIFKCISNSDVFTTNESDYGNKALQYPIGLISADEVAFAGGVLFKNNTNYYLYTNQYYWTMTPRYFEGANDTAYIFDMEKEGFLGNGVVSSSLGVRPVINIKATAEITGGDGTSTNPYIIE